MATDEIGDEHNADFPMQLVIRPPATKQLHFLITTIII